MTELKLTRNQELVFGTLDKFGAPLSAYEILDRLRSKGLRAPLQVYRALEKLMAMGAVHRLESINAFVICRHDGCEGHSACVFAICETCGRVSEFLDAKISSHVKAWAKADGFQLKSTAIELRGECRECSSP